jgi:hypothetical protein
MSFCFRRIPGLLAALCGAAMAAFGAGPALTRIEDVIYRADGTRFQGVALIEWKSFVTAAGDNIGMQAKVVSIIDGVLQVQLAPTTNVVGGAYYLVKYNSSGKVQFVETWEVPPSATKVKLADVRSELNPGSGTVSSGASQISDITGLSAELAVRPSKGAGYAASRTAIINNSGLLEGAAGTADDCVKVDGTSGPCGTVGNSNGFVDQEVPQGTMDGTNAAFVLTNVPSPSGSLMVYRNGLLMKNTVDYTTTGNVLTFVSGALPQSGDLLLASYRTAGSGQASTSLVQATQVLCSSPGAATAEVAQTRLGSCTIPAGVLHEGDRLEVRTDWTHTGQAVGFVIWVEWSGSAMMSRTLSAGESLLAARSDVAINAAAAQWSSSSWGAITQTATSAGTAAINRSASITLNFGAALGSYSTTDSVGLRNFTVLRYPAQSNP